MNRRAFLGTLGAGVAVAGAGCSSVVEAVSPPPYLESVRVRNRDDAAHEVHVTVDQRGETVAETAFDLGPREPREYGGPYRPWEQVDCEWAGRGPFAVSCTVDGERTATASVDQDDSTDDEAYAAVEFGIRDGGAVRERYTLVGGPARHTRCDEPTPTR